MKCEEYISLLQMIIQMKTQEALKDKILWRGNKPIVEWLQNLQFQADMISSAEEGLRKVEHKINEEQERNFKLLKGLYTNSQTSS